jgi:enoyl-CoA hydratase
MTEPPAFSSPVLTLERDGHVGTLWLDRPEARNAMGPEFWRDLPLAMAALAADDEVRVVIIAAKGPAFSAGLDLKAMLAGAANASSRAGTSRVAKAVEERRGVLQLQSSISAVAACPKPVIGAVHGYCLGGGVDLIAACDIRLASSDAIFSVRETKIAIVADLGSLQRLPAIIGAGHLAELAYTGKDIDARRAERIGLVNELSKDRDELLVAARGMADEIAANSPLAVQGTKAILRAGEGRSVAEGLDYVATWNAAFLRSEDLQEAMSAFMEKRAPQFKGA